MIVRYLHVLYINITADARHFFKIGALSDLLLSLGKGFKIRKTNKKKDKIGCPKERRDKRKRFK